MGVIPSRGNIPPMPGKPRSGNGLGVRGPLARSPADLKLALQVLGGPDEAESVAWNWRLPAARYDRLSDYRIGYILDDAGCEVSADVRVVLDVALKALQGAGADLVEGWPGGFIPKEQFHAFRVLSASRKAGKSLPAGLKKDVFNAKGATAVARDIWREYFRAHDAFLLPVAFVPAFPHDHSEPLEERWLQTSEGPRPYLNLSFWVSFATLAGLPVTTAPAGFTESGLPVGIQIVGPYLEDATPIDLAGRFADVIGGAQLKGGAEGKVDTPG
jgi:amidase